VDELVRVEMKAKTDHQGSSANIATLRIPTTKRLADWGKVVTTLGTDFPGRSIFHVPECTTHTDIEIRDR
jgi:hypothetical protein